MASADVTTLNGSSNANSGSTKLSAAQRLMQKHDEPHNPTIEEVPDEEDLTPHPHPTSSSILESTDEPPAAPGWAAPMSAKAAGKRKDAPSGKATTPVLDTSDESFPGLGGSKVPVRTAPSAWVSKTGPPVTNGATNGTPTNGRSTPVPARSTPPAPLAASQRAPKAAAPSSKNLSGEEAKKEAEEARKNEPYVKSYIFDPKELSRSATKKPLPELLRDINKKYRLNFTQTTGAGGAIKITVASTKRYEAIIQQALKELGSYVSKTSEKVPIPRSARAQLIGRGGANIKSLQEQSGARIQMPKSEDTPEAADDDDDMIDVVVEGNPIAIRLAKDGITGTVSAHNSNVNAKLRTIPAEFFPFISGAHNSNANALEGRHGIHVRVPSHHTWTTQPPPELPPKGQAPAFVPAAGDQHITLGGDRAGVQAARAEIEALAQQLRQQLTLDQVAINKGRHQFIVGGRGIPVQDFFAETGCAIILPGDDEDEMITIVGPADKIQLATEKAMDLAMGMQNQSLDISRQLRSMPGARDHARNITQYLRDRNEIEKIERLHQAHIFTPFDVDGGAAPWELYSRDGKNTIRAQSEIKNVVMAHPPSRMASIPIDPFFHQYLRNDITPTVKQDYGVHVVIPNASQANAPVLLVFEGEGGAEPEYQIPRGQPTNSDIQAFQRGLEDAQNHILDIISKQAKIISTTIDVPRIFHDKLKKFIKKEQQDREADQIPVRVSAAGTLVTLRGPAPAVESLAAKVNDFVRQAIEDEKERGFTLSFAFPKEKAGKLVGKGYGHLAELRENFDVDINVQNGEVEIKGPKAKAEAAKSHIQALGRQYEDEAEATLNIEPQYHSELIGAKGAIINRLQDRYKVQIHFPRQKSSKDDDSNADAASDAGQQRSQNKKQQPPNHVIVKGSKSGVAKATEEILSLLQYNKDNSHEATVTVKAGQISSLIGQRGNGMDEIRQSTGARVDVPNAKELSDDTEVVIKIKGTQSQMAQAKKLIEEKRDVYNKTIKKTLAVDKKHHGALIGPGGSKIRDIVVKSGGSDSPREIVRTVQFPKAEADGNVIKIEGMEDIVEKIIATINQIVSTLESQETAEVNVPTDKHRMLIGRGGSDKKALESKFNVTLDIPRQGNGQTAVKVSGQPEDVAKAKLHIEDLVKEQEGQTVVVPRKVHHSVADNGQFFRRLRNDGVTVDHAGSKVPPKPAAPTNVRANGGDMPLITDNATDNADVHSWKTVDLSASDLTGDIPWILRGPPDNVAKAQAAVEAAIQQALENSTIGYLTLPDPSTYRYVIGPKGKNVDSIRKDTGTKITVPRDQTKDEAIEVVGSADGVEAAKVLILKAVKDGNASNGNRS
ncbi:Vigilin [Lachnellula occidentalis]|uniref:Vigilin n=1 Tax=Lachnellula occidentalis TaxID=215460 RepID=A0A8H8S866_9HELO|nr:Vigilin [Lachnellula occidentalis]